MAKTISHNARNAEKRQETESPKTVKVIDLSVPALSLNDAGDEDGSFEEIQAKQQITDEVSYEKELCFWLQLPGVGIWKMPLEWEISMKYKDKTVKVIGAHKKVRQFAVTSDDESAGEGFNEAFKSLVNCCRMSAENGGFVQPSEAV